MRKVLRSVISPLISLVIVMLGNGFFNTFASLRIAIDGYANWVIGILNASYFGGLMLGSMYMQRLIDRIGHIRTFAIFASINSVVIMTQAMIIDPISWTIFRFLVGLCAAGFFVVIESWLLLSTGIKTRGKVLSLYMVTVYLAQGFGQFILNFSPLTSLLPFAITIVLSSLSVIPVCMMKSSGPFMLEHSMTRLFQIFKNAPLGLIGCFIAGMVMSSFYGLAPIFGKEIGLSILKISEMMGFTILGGLLLQWPIGHLSDLFNRRRVLIGTTFALMVTSFVLFRSISFPYYVLVSVMILFGGISFTLYPLCITYTCDFFSEKYIIGITCSLLIVYGTGSIIGPLISSLVMELVGPGGLFLYISLLAIAFILVALWRVVQAKPLPDEQGDYLPLPRPTSLAFYLDPRSDLSEDEDDEDDELYPLTEEDEEEDEEEGG